MTNESRITQKTETSPDQQERADLILTFVQMAQDREIQQDDEGAEILYRGANDALIDLLDGDSAQREV